MLPGFEFTATDSERLVICAECGMFLNPSLCHNKSRTLISSMSKKSDEVSAYLLRSVVIPALIVDSTANSANTELLEGLTMLPEL